MVSLNNLRNIFRYSYILFASIIKQNLARPFLIISTNKSDAKVNSDYLRFEAAVNELYTEGRQIAVCGSHESMEKLNIIISDLDILGKLLGVTALQRVHSVVGVKCFSKRRSGYFVYKDALYRSV
jgi:hypothetical protein